MAGVNWILETKTKRESVQKSFCFLCARGRYVCLGRPMANSSFPDLVLLAFLISLAVNQVYHEYLNRQSLDYIVGSKMMNYDVVLVNLNSLKSFHLAT